MLLWPMLKKYWKLFASMMAVSALGIALMTGLGAAYRVLDISLADYVSGYGYADAVITTDLTDNNVVSQLRRIPGVKGVDCRIVTDVHMKTETGKNFSMRGFSYGIRDFQQFYVWHQQESAQYPNVALDVKFAQYNGISAGDVLELKIGDTYYTVCVGRIVSSAECLAVQQDVYSWGENGDFGYIFVPEELLYGTEYYNKADQFLIRFDEWAEGDGVLDAAQTLLEQQTVVRNSFLYRDSMVYAKIRSNLDPVHALAVTVPTIFFVCMIAVVSLFLSQVIHQNRRQIGILRALGFEKSQIRALFAVLTLIMSLVASAVGIVIGYRLMLFTAKAFGDFFPLPRVYYGMEPRLCIAAVAATVAAGQLAIFFGTTLIGRIAPSEAMSREMPTAAKTPRAVQKLLSCLSPSAKFGLTSIFRNRKRFLFSAVCVAFTVMMILASIAFNTSKNSIISGLYDQRIFYDCLAFFTEEPDAALLQGLQQVDGMGRMEQGVFYYRRMSGWSGQENALLCAISPDNTMVAIPGNPKGTLAVPETGILLEKHTAAAIGAAPGDTVTMDGVPMTVLAITDQCVNRISYISPLQAQQLGAPDRYAVFCNTSNRDALLDYLENAAGFFRADFTDVLREGNEDVFKLYTLGVAVLVVFSVIMGVVIVYNTMQTNLLDQKKELSVLRAIGFQISQISGIWLLQSLSQFVLSAAVGVPAGVAVAKYALKSISVDNREYPFANVPSQYIITLALVLVYILISHFSAMRSIRRWDISENTKEKE